MLYGRLVFQIKRFVLKQRLVIFGSLTVLLLLLAFYIFKDLPSPKKLSSDQYPVSTLIYDRNDKLLYEIYAEQNRTPVKLQHLPPTAKQATIAIEDKDFYRHRPFDF